MKLPMRVIPLFLAFGMAVLDLTAQSTDMSPLTTPLPPVLIDPSGVLESPSVSLKNRVNALKALKASIEAKESEVARFERQRANSTNEVAKADASRQLDKSAGDLVQLRRRFSETAAGVDMDLFIQQEEVPFSWEEQLGKLLKPVLSEIERVTAEGRLMAQLREEEERYGEQSNVAGTAIKGLKQLMPHVDDPGLKRFLEEQESVWRERQTFSQNQAEAARLRIEEINSKRQTLLDSSTSYIKDFFRSRGLNLLMAIASFCIFFFGARAALWAWRKSTKGNGQDRFANRVFSLAIHSGSVLVGILATLLILNLRGDWFLLGLIIIFLVGVAWASIKTIPDYIESISLVLNIGSIREGERLVFDGIAWRVDSLNFATILVNERLDGGEIRVPVRQLVGMVSRPFGDHEPVFPTQRGDWVSLEDGRFGQIILQTPSLVTIRELGGAESTYQTSTFLDQNPRNLSNGYRVETRFRLEHTLQPLATTTIPDLMEARLHQDLPKLVPSSAIRNVRVEFAMAAPSSLEFEVEVDLDGSVGSHFEELGHALQRMMVDACNEHGWKIPLDQLVVHNAVK